MTLSELQVMSAGDRVVMPFGKFVLPPRSASRAMRCAARAGDVHGARWIVEVLKRLVARLSCRRACRAAC